jgi:hypothetical protein
MSTVDAVPLALVVVDPTLSMLACPKALLPTWQGRAATRLLG